jgi:transposase
MMIIGIDAHKRSHTAVTIDDNGRQQATKTVGTTTQDHLKLLKWGGRSRCERLWAIEDCRHMTRRLERDLIAAGEAVVRVSPKLMADVRDSARTYGKSDPIDALAVARAALREPELPARLDGLERELRLLVTARISSPNARASFPHCAGICTNSIRDGYQRPTSTGPAHSTP